jgi:hypothetical protein
LAVPRDEEVLGLKVPVDDSLLVGGRQTARALPGVVERLADGKMAYGQLLPQGFPFQKLRDDVRSTVLRPEVVDGQDARMVHRRRGARLLLEAAEPVGVLRERGGSRPKGASRFEKV